MCGGSFDQGQVQRAFGIVLEHLRLPTQLFYEIQVPVRL